MFFNNGIDVNNVAIGDPSVTNDKWRIHEILYNTIIHGTPAFFTCFLKYFFCTLVG